MEQQEFFLGTHQDSSPAVNAPEPVFAVPKEISKKREKKQLRTLLRLNKMIANKETKPGIQSDDLGEYTIINGQKIYRPETPDYADSYKRSK
jgi:hypothetical protein